MTATNAIDTDAHGREIWSMNVLRSLLCLLKQKLRFKSTKKLQQRKQDAFPFIHWFDENVFQTLFQHGIIFDGSNVFEMHSRPKCCCLCHRTIISIRNRCRARSLMMTQLSQYFSIKINDDNNKIEKKIITKQKR